MSPLGPARQPTAALSRPASLLTRLTLPSLLALALLVSASAHASSPRVALVVSGPFDDEASQLESRLRAELLVSGFEVLTVQRNPPVGPVDLAQIAKDSGSGAAVSIIRSDRWLSAEVWLSESRNGPAMIHQVRPEPISHDAPAIVAIRAAEVLRAAAVDLPRPPPPTASSSSPGPEPPPPTSAPATASSSPPPVPPPASPLADRGASPPLPREPSFSLTAAISAVGGPGGIPVGFGPSLGLSWALADAWSLECRGTGPVSSTIGFEGGDAEVDQEILSTSLRFDIDTGQTIAPFVSVGGGAHRAGVHGNATAPREALSDSAWTAIGIVEAGLRLRASPQWSVRSGLGAFYAASRPVVAVDDRVLAHGGRPGFHGSAGLELGW